MVDNPAQVDSELLRNRLLIEALNTLCQRPYLRLESQYVFPCGEILLLKDAIVAVNLVQQAPQPLLRPLRLFQCLSCLSRSTISILYG